MPWHKKRAWAKACSILCAAVATLPLLVNTPAQAQKLGLSYSAIDSPNKTGLVVLKEKANGSLEDAGSTIGGKVWVGISIEIPGKGSFTPGIENVTLRVREEEDKALGTNPQDQHPEAENHIDVVMPFTPDSTKTGFKWQKKVGDGEWIDTTEAFTTPNTGASTVSYRVLHLWETSKTQEAEGSKLYDHNGAHTVFAVAVNGQSNRAPEFAQLVSENGTGATASAKTTVQVKNLVITGVSTSNGTKDYFKFNSDGSAPNSLQHPSVTFTFADEDRGDTNCIYNWRVRVRGTDKEDWSDSVLYTDTASPGSPVTVTINTTPVAADSPRTSVTEWGTYNFEIKVEKSLGGQSEVIDSINYRSTQMYIPYTMPAPNGKVFGHEAQFLYEPDGSTNVFLTASYYLRDDSKQSNDLAASLRLDLIPPSLGEPVISIDSLGRQINTPYNDVDIHEFAESQINLDSTNITIISAMDDHAREYRDHKPHPILAKNRRLARYRDEWDLNVWFDGGPNAVTSFTPADRLTFINYLRLCFQRAGIDITVNLKGVTAGSTNVINYGGPFNAWGLSAAQLAAAGGTDRDYHTVIINEISNASSSDAGMGLAMYHPYQAGSRQDWNGSCHRPGLISILTTGYQSAIDEIKDEAPLPPGAGAWAGTPELQYVCNAIVHEAAHALAMTTNAGHCLIASPTCVIRAGTNRNFTLNMSTLNLVRFPDDVGGFYNIYEPFHNRTAEINELQRRTNRPRQ